MKVLAIMVLAVAAVFGAVVFLWPAPASGPEPIHYGRDACAHCRMHISQPGFGGELRDHTGVLTKYDDIGCLLRALAALHREVPEAWVEDHGGGGFVPLLNAVLVRGERLDTPMGSGIVAFADAEAARQLTSAQGGELVTLEQLLHDPALMAPARAGTREQREEGS